MHVRPMPFLVLALLVTWPAIPAPQSRGGVERLAGEWVFEMEGDAQPQRVVVAVEGDSFRGRVYGQPLAGTPVGTGPSRDDVVGGSVASTRS